MIDPTGNFSLGGMMAASDIRSILGNMQIDFGANFLEAAIAGESPSALSMGFGAITSMTPVAMFKTFGKVLKVETKMGSRDKAVYAVGKAPKKHELESAEFIADKLGAGVYFRGGRDAAEADAFISGKLWEFKKSLVGTDTSVKSAVEQAVKQFEKHNKGVPIRIYIDGRGTLDYATFLKGMNKVYSGQRNRVSEVMVVLKDGTLKYWP